MARLNVPLKRHPQQIFTHEGAPAKRITPEQRLRRSVMTCMLWEKTFYEDGVSIADRIRETISLVDPLKCVEIAKEARSSMHLRHIPLLIAREMSKLEVHKRFVGGLLPEIIQRADELTEFLAIYWEDGRQSLSSQVKKGLAKAFPKFDAYQLAKYNRDGVVKLRDVLFLCHAKPKDPEQERVWKKLVDGTLEPPDTWEVALSTGENKKQAWTRLLASNKLGTMALIKNLRNIEKAQVTDTIVIDALERAKAQKILPFRFLAAAKYAPKYNYELEKLMLKSAGTLEKLPGKTVLLVDCSGSMDDRLSAKSEMLRYDAARGLAILAREICERVDIFCFADIVHRIPNRTGFGLADAMPDPYNGTYLGKAVTKVNNISYDRLIVITDEQSHDRIPDPIKRGYIVNVASYQNGVGYGRWIHIDGWSEKILDYIREYERR